MIFLMIFTKLSDASATYTASDPEELIPLFIEISNTTTILEKSEYIITGLVVQMN